jgi:phosphatidylglycerophosphate synthase
MHGPPHDPVGNRRPIATRELKLSQQAASWLSRCGISANAISVAGMVAGILAGVLLALTPAAASLAPALWFAAAVLIQLRLAANMLDGMVAVGSGTASPTGELFNEIPDRASDTAVLVGLGYAAGGDVVLGYVAALAAMATAYVRAVGRAAGGPAEFCGPMAKQQRMFIVTIVALICGAAEIVDARPAIRGYGVPALALAVIAAGAAGTTLRRLVRIARALRSAA